MKAIRITWPNGEARTFALPRPVECLGKSPDNDISLPDENDLPNAALQIRLTDVGIEVTSLAKQKAQMPKVAGKVKSKFSLVLGDCFELCGLTMRLVEKSLGEKLTRTGSDLENTPQDSAEQRMALNGSPFPPSPSETLSKTQMDTSLGMLLKFSEALLKNESLPELLELMLDQVISLTHADRGYLLLVGEGGVTSIRVARGMGQQTLSNASELLSESIVRKALETRSVQLVHDALSDPTFSQSESIITKRFHSILCMPLVSDNVPIGLIYLGNDQVAHRFDQKSVDLLQIWSAQGALILKNALLMNELSLDNAAMTEVMERHQFGQIVGDCEPMRELFRKIAKVAPKDATVLIMGETGTGKELVAQEIHLRSRRANGPFVTVNCGAIPENLMESELFGHLRGAFTGAVSTQRGKFQIANGGTLFLDEVGEMPPAMQVKLLRAIQERMVTKVGDNRPERVDIRIVAATNRVLEDEVNRGNFRADLFYRLNVVQLMVPPLRQRVSDISILANTFLERLLERGDTLARGFSQKALNALRHYDWPGNVRELEHLIEKASVLSDGLLLTEEDLGLTDDASTQLKILSLAQAKEDFQRRYIDQVLELNDGNRAKTAEDLGIDQRTLYRHLAERKNAANSSSGKKGDGHGEA